MTRRRLPLRLLPALLAALLLALPAGAQELTGVALGPDEEPLARVPVVLHRVGGGSGAFVATDTTNPEGGFRFELEPDSAVYFAALRYEGRMYIGPAAQAGGEAVSGYILRVDPSTEAGAVASALSGQAPPPAPAVPAARTSRGVESDLGAFLLVGLLALVAVAAFLFAAPRFRQRRTLDSVIELASLENALADADTDDERARLRAARDRLREQLAPRS